jgi:hypothetical protein
MRYGGETPQLGNESQPVRLGDKSQPVRWGRSG